MNGDPRQSNPSHSRLLSGNLDFLANNPLAIEIKEPSLGPRTRGGGD
jgi:hypothetical protein